MRPDVSPIVSRTAIRPPLSTIALGCAAALTLALTACGGDSPASTSDSASSQSGSQTTSGVVVGSYFRGATVCLDQNDNLHCDDGEPRTVTDAQGRYTLTGNGSTVLAEIGTDATEIDPATGSAQAVSQKLLLRAPKEAPTVISAFSTSVAAEMQANGLSLQDATAKVAIAAGVPAAKLLADFNLESDATDKAALQAASNDTLARIGHALADADTDASLATVLAEAALTDRYYQTKAPYHPQQDVTTYEAPPAGFSTVSVQVMARHGSRGLSSLKYDLAVYNMWLQAKADGALTPLGEKLGADVLAIMKANFLLGYGVQGISTPGYGNETQVGIQEHTLLAQRMLKRQPAFWQQVGQAATSAPRQIVTVTSGVDRAVDSGNFFVQSLKAAQPSLASLVTYPAAPAPYPDAGTAVTQPAGTNRFLLYFHKLVKATDLVSNVNDPLYQTYQDSQAYQAYKASDTDLATRQSGLFTTDTARAAGRTLLLRLFTQAFVDKIDNGSYSFANTGSQTFTSDDGKFSATLKGDGKTTIASPGDAGSLLYELYVIAPAMKDEAGVDFTPYMPIAQAKVFAQINDASDFYDKGPGMRDKGDVTYRMAQILVDDLFNEVDAVARGDLSHAAKLRFAHAEIVIPLASRLGLKNVLQQVSAGESFDYATNPWRGEYVSPMAANLQWEVYRNDAGKLLVKMLYNERETDFKADCDSAREPGTAHFYAYEKLKTCYAHVATTQ